MRLKSCHIENFMGLHSLDLDLDADTVVLLGDNAAGKSSLIQALRIAVGAWLSSAKDKKVSSPSISSAMIRHIIRLEGFEYIKELTDEARISAVAKIDGSLLEWTLARSAGKSSRMRTKEALCIRDAAAAAFRPRDQREVPTTLPLIAYFGAGRERNNSRRTFGKGPEARIMGYANCLNSSLDVNRMLSRWDRIDRIASKNEDANEVRTALEDCLSALIPGEHRVTYDPSLEEPIVLGKDQAASFTALSDGYRSILEIGMDLSLRAIQLNPSLGADAITNTPGVVLIDEIGQHLHPSWQIDLLQNLRSAFPRVQFIVSTHSPLIALHAGKGVKVYRMRSGEHGPTATIVDTIGESVEATLQGQAFGPIVTWGPALLEAVQERTSILASIVGEPSEEQRSALASSTQKMETLRGHRPSASEDLVRRVSAELEAEPLSASMKATTHLEALRQRAQEARQEKREPIKG